MSAEQIKKPPIAIAKRLFDLFKVQGFFGISQKTLHLASKRFARSAVISMDAPAKITDFGRKSVQKTLFHKCRRRVGINSADIIKILN